MFDKIYSLLKILCVYCATCNISVKVVNKFCKPFDGHLTHLISKIGYRMKTQYKYIGKLKSLHNSM